MDKKTKKEKLESLQKNLTMAKYNKKVAEDAIEELTAYIATLKTL